MADKALAGRWSDTMAIIVMFREASGKKKIRMASYLPSWSQADHPKPALVRLGYVFRFRQCSITNPAFRGYTAGDRSGPGSTERTGQD